MYAKIQTFFKTEDAIKIRRKKSFVMNVLTIRSDTISENVTKLKTEITKIRNRKGQELPTEARRNCSPLDKSLVLFHLIRITKYVIQDRLN